MFSSQNKMEQINQRINEEFCYDTINNLSDENLFIEYTNCESVKNKIHQLSER